MEEIGLNPEIRLGALATYAWPHVWGGVVHVVRASGGSRCSAVALGSMTCVKSGAQKQARTQRHA
jgi:hypothetical protein